VPALNGNRAATGPDILAATAGDTGRVVAKLTHQGLRALKAGEWASDGAPRGGGTLAARRTERGVLFYFRYTGHEGRREAEPLGQWAGSGGPLSLEAARAKAQELSIRYRAGDRDLRAVLRAEEREAAREREAQQKAHEAHEARQQATLGALLLAYVEQMRRDGKASAAAVEAAIRRHVEAAWPKLWATAHADVSSDDLLAVVARVAEAGKLTEARKLRAYLSGAYNAGLRARQDARGLAALRDLRIAHNPARDLVAIDGGNNARDRALSATELRAYWARIKDMEGSTGGLLRFHLLTGAQRVEQLARLTTADYVPDGPSVRLRDSKGRRKQARVHEVPLIPEAAAALIAMQGGALGPYLFTVTGGQSGAVYATLQHRLRAVAEMMVKDGDLPGGLFTPGDLRRTVETRLAAAGVSMEVRAQLQSHGLGGVQARHYDRHDYLREKRGALEALWGIVAEAGSARVVPMRGRTVA
jgi:hypothetical protein